MRIKVTKIGGSIGFILPKKIADRMRLSHGVFLYLTELPEGGFRLTPDDPLKRLDMNQDFLQTLAK